MQYTYLDNASTSSPKPVCMIEGMKKYLDNFGANPFRGKTKLSHQSATQIFQTRELLCHFLGLNSPELISFTYNATYAINMLFYGLLKEEDHVIMSSYDHNAVLRPLCDLSKNNISFDVWKCDSNGDFDLNALEKLILDNTKLLFFSHSSNVLGKIIPLDKIAKIAKEKKLLLGLDCSQSLGHVDLNLAKYDVDFVAGTCHKGLLGPPGVGFMYIKEPREVKSVIHGGGGHLATSKKMPSISPLKYEAGTLNYLGIAGLKSSLEWILSKKDSIKEKKVRLIKLLINELINLKNITIYGNADIDFSIPVVSFNIKGIVPSQVKNYLEANHRIIVRTGLHCAPLIHEAIKTMPNGAVRVSLGVFNEEEDIYKLVKALKKIK